MTDPAPKCRFQDPDTDHVRLCVRDAGHAGLHSWPFDVPPYVGPTCRACGGDMMRCPCPAVDADGRTNRRYDRTPDMVDSAPQVHVAPPRPPPPPVRGPHCARHPDADDPQCVACAVVRSGYRPEPAPARPWCPGHGWERDPACRICDRVHAEAAAQRVPSTEQGE